MKKTRKFLLLLLCFSILLGSSSVAFAGTYTVHRAKCTRCGQFNSSYGYDPNFKYQDIRYNAGAYCPICKKTVPAGESHTCEYSSDKYFFLCKSNSCSRLSVPNRVYFHFYDNPPEALNHYVYYVNEDN